MNHGAFYNEVGYKLCTWSCTHLCMKTYKNFLIELICYAPKFDLHFGALC